MNIQDVRSIVGEKKTLQGNLDPCLLYASSKNIEIETQKLLDSLTSKRHILNLGHGVYPI
jgi:uroporphyrinogen decarboxylase